MARGLSSRDPTHRARSESLSFWNPILPRWNRKQTGSRSLMPSEEPPNQHGYWLRRRGPRMFCQQNAEPDHRGTEPVPKASGRAANRPIRRLPSGALPAQQ